MLKTVEGTVKTSLRQWRILRRVMTPGSTSHLRLNAGTGSYGALGAR